MPTEIKNSIEIIINKIKENFNIKQIILFGSFAYGTPNGSSDIDLCVIMELNNERKLKIMRDIREKLYDVLNVPIDLIIYTEEEFNERISNSTTLEYKIAKEGKVLYAA